MNDSQDAILAIFPPEVMSCILSYLGADLVDLWSCCLVNKDWYSLTTPLLWNRPSFNSQSSYLAFKDTILNNPKARRYVNDFSFDMYMYQIRSIEEISNLVSLLPNLKFISLPFVNLLPVPTTFLRHVAYKALPGLRRLHYRDTRISFRRVLQDLCSVLAGCTELQELAVDLDTDYPLLHNLDMNEIDVLPTSPLKSLSLRCVHSSSVLVERILIHTPDLEHLSFTMVQISDSFTENLWKSCPKLKSLEIELTYSDSNRYTPIEMLCHRLAQVYQGQLKQLKLCFHREPYVPQLVLNELWRNHGPHLESLELCRFTISHKSLACLAQNISPTLKRLCLSNIMEIRKPPFDVWETLLSKCGGSLQVLHLDSNASFNDEIASIVAKHCHKLRELSLKRTWTSDIAVKKILETNGKTLRILNLSKTSISGDTISEITKQCSYITDLNVEWPRWTEACAEVPLSATEFVEFIRLHGGHLEALNIDRWPITNLTLEAIAKYGRGLKVLTFRDNGALSDKYLREIMKSCKKLQRLYILLSYPYTVEGLSYEVLTEVQNRYIDYFAEVDGIRTFYS
ncbi:hypothetical protein K7432_001923 [Basidiobolus ranarum]|uniref:F-box domain-containing protein n=1 Tax=Basidiobolus ranarum TaxID=34480 RepID=A0ABR2W8N2_9FUNG